MPEKRRGLTLRARIVAVTTTLTLLLRCDGSGALQPPLQVECAVLPLTSSASDAAGSGSASWPLAVRLLLGIGLAELGWVAFSANASIWPVWCRTLIGFTVLVGGPGAAACVWLTADLSPVRRLVLAACFGLALTPLLAHVLGLLDRPEWLPASAALLLGVAAATWPRRPTARADSRHAGVALALSAAVALALGGVAFAHRLDITPAEVVVHGEYDAFDLSYYAAIAGELSHTVPPESPFRAGRPLVHSYYPHLALAVVHRFADVPLLDLYFRYAWPIFLLLAALMCFVFVERLAGPLAALVASVLLVAGSDLSYLAAWFFRPSGWDDVLWSTNFLSPGAESLYFNNWTPALGVVFASLFAIDARLRGGRMAWSVLAAAGVALTLLAKPFATVLLLGALAAIVVLPGSSRRVRWQVGVVAGLALAMAVPYLLFIVSGQGDAQASFGPAVFPLPRLMFERLEIWDGTVGLVEALGVPVAAGAAAAGALALPVFLVGGIGAGVVGLPGVWRALRHPDAESVMWRVLAWGALGAFLAPMVVASTPYHETMQIHQFGLYLLPAFVGRALAGVRRPGPRALAMAVVLAVALPSTVHYLHRKWTDGDRTFARISSDEMAVAEVLRRTDPETTRLLHGQPSDPGFLAILAERRSVLSWSRYERDVTGERRVVEAFFRSAMTSEQAAATLDRFEPSHIVEYRGRDLVPPAVQPRLRLMVETPTVRVWRVAPSGSADRDGATGPAE